MPIDDLGSLLLTISAPLQTQAWLQAERFGRQAERWRAYSNLLVLEVVLAWVREELDPGAEPWPTRGALAPFWSVCSGVALVVNGRRWLLVPDEVIDGRLRVPCEWVDLPAWRADYYLAVRLRLDDGLVQLWGWTTHRRVHAQRPCDPWERTYVLGAEQLLTDLAALQALTADLLVLHEPLCSEVPPVPPLDDAQAHQLMHRLSENLCPRLALPFALWAALVENEVWRVRFHRLRQHRPDGPWSLRRWLSRGVPELPAREGWCRPATWSASDIRADRLPAPGFVRTLTIAGSHLELGILQCDPGIWRFRLRSAEPAGRVSAGIVLRLLTADFEDFPNNTMRSDSEVDELFIDVALEPDEGVVLEIEPQPDDYGCQVLYF